jgi:hypothetical protein
MLTCCCISYVLITALNFRMCNTWNTNEKVNDNEWMDGWMDGCPSGWIDKGVHDLVGKFCYNHLRNVNTELRPYVHMLTATSCYRLLQMQISCESRDSSVGIALGYGLDDRDSRVRFPAGDGNFSLHHRVQNGSGAHPASYPMGTRGSFPGGGG